jgi:predicted nucleic acid-binding protein
VIVLDASVVVELLTNGALADSIRRDLGSRTGPSRETAAKLRSRRHWRKFQIYWTAACPAVSGYIVPHLLDVEVMSALRNLVASRRVDSHRGEQLVAGLASLPAERYSHAPLLDRIWELRHNFTAYDATYIALAEATSSVLYTSDAKLVRGHRARVLLFTS